MLDENANQLEASDNSAPVNMPGEGKENEHPPTKNGIKFSAPRKYQFITVLYAVSIVNHNIANS